MWTAGDGHDFCLEAWGVTPLARDVDHEGLKVSLSRVCVFVGGGVYSCMCMVMFVVMLVFLFVLVSMSAAWRRLGNAFVPFLLLSRVSVHGASRSSPDNLLYSRLIRAPKQTNAGEISTINGRNVTRTAFCSSSQAHDPRARRRLRTGVQVALQAPQHGRARPLRRQGRGTGAPQNTLTSSPTPTPTCPPRTRCERQKCTG